MDSVYNYRNSKGKEMSVLRFTIRQARTHAGLTQEEMAQRLGINRSTYIRIEKDMSRATVAQIRRIVQVTGIPADCLLLDEDPAQAG